MQWLLCMSYSEGKRDLLWVVIYIWEKKRKWRQKFLRRRHVLRKPRLVCESCGSTNEWWNNVKREDLPNTWWKRHFRMSKECFFEILDEVKPLLDLKPNRPNYRFLSAVKELAITLYCLKDTSSLWMTANTFGIHQCTVSKNIVEVCKAIMLFWAQMIRIPCALKMIWEKKFGIRIKVWNTAGFLVHRWHACRNKTFYRKFTRLL